MKYMSTNISNISFDRKKLICIISFICILSLISCQGQSQNQNLFLSKNRNLQYSLGSIYYELVYPINNLTGTGDRLKDVPYKVQCKIKQCESGCCVGEIDKMLCGDPADCAIYLEESRKPTLLAGIVIPVGLLIIFIVLFISFRKVYKLSVGQSICLAFGCLTIVLIPFVAYYVYKESKDNVNNKSKEGYNYSFKFFLNSLFFI